MVTDGQVSASLATKTLAEHNPQKLSRCFRMLLLPQNPEGKTKALPKHLDKPTPVVRARSELSGAQLTKLLCDAFEFSSINEEELDEDGKPVVMIGMPVEWFEKLREAFKL